MSESIVGDSVLPASHVFLTAAWGRRQRTVAVPRWGAVLVAVALGLAGLWSLGCSVYVVGHDSLVAATLGRERDLQYRFEDKIAALERDLERKTTEHAQLERTVGGRLAALTSQEAELRRRADTIATLARDVLHLAAHGVAPKQAAALTTPVSPATSDGGPAPAAGTATAVGSEGEHAAALAKDFAAIATDQDREMDRLRTAAADRVTRYREALTQAGLSESRFGHEAPAAGGPFVPLDPKADLSGFDRASLALGGTLAEAVQLQAAVSRTPFDKPLAGDPEITSPFGPRLDPFLGRPALHTGIDLREDTGTAVLATAPGRVVFAGTASGYGTMVEIDHGAGLSTRYAHLSATTVGVGDSVTTGSVVGRVGATGRATGPHLHYETRIDGEPVDPMRFLQAGFRLEQADAH